MATSKTKIRGSGQYDGPLAYDDPISMAVAGYLRLKERGIPRDVTVIDFTIDWRYDNILPRMPEANLWKLTIRAHQATGIWKQP